MDNRINPTALTHTCPIHDFLTVNNSHPMPGCIEQRDGACCAFLMLRFVAYCKDPESFVRKAREVIESNHIVPANQVSHTCPIHDYLAEGFFHPTLGCVEQWDGACCAFLMLRFVAYCTDPEAFARKARKVVESNHIVSINHVSLACPIHNYMAQFFSRTAPNCIKQRDGEKEVACCAFLMLRFVAYCKAPEEFALKARKVIEKYC